MDVRRCRPPDLKKASRSCSGSVRNPWLCDRASLMASPVKSFKRSSPTLKEAKALFTVPQSTVGFFENAGRTALVETLERSYRTVKQVRFPVHGATRNLLVSITQPTRSVGALRNGVPRRHLHSAPRRTMVGVQPTPAPGRCVQQRRGCEPGVQPQASRPPLTRSRRVGGRCVTAASSAVTHFGMRRANRCPSRTCQDCGNRFFPVPCP